MQRRIAKWALPGAVLIFLAACGGGGEAGDSSAGTDIDKATIMLASKSVSWTPVYAAECAQTFKKHGLDASITVSQQGTTPAVAALISGDVATAFLGVTSATQPMQSNHDIQLLMRTNVGYTVQFVMSEEWLAKKGVTSESSLSDKVNALRSARFGHYNPGDSVEQLVDYVLPKYGVDPDKDITLVSLNNNPSIFAALKAGSVDAFAASAPAGDQAVAAGVGKVVFNATDVPGLDTFPYLVGIVTRDTVSEHPEVVKAIVNGIADAQDTLKRDPESLKDCIRAKFSDVDDESFDAAYAAATNPKTIPTSPLITPDIFKTITDFASGIGKPVELGYDEAVASDIVKEAFDGR